MDLCCTASNFTLGCSVESSFHTCWWFETHMPVHGEANTHTHTDPVNMPNTFMCQCASKSKTRFHLESLCCKHPPGVPPLLETSLSDSSASALHITGKNYKQLLKGPADVGCK